MKRAQEGRGPNHFAASIGGICVQVCPTGIDIRNGLAIRVIGCAPVSMRAPVGHGQDELPRGLIRYSTENAIKKGWVEGKSIAHVFRPRTLDLRRSLPFFDRLCMITTRSRFWSISSRRIRRPRGRRWFDREHLSPAG